jgi:hypothetical protein
MWGKSIPAPEYRYSEAGMALFRNETSGVSKRKQPT